MSVVNLQAFDANVWIPPGVTANWKVTITRLDGTVDDITDLIINLHQVNVVTDGVGTFEVEFPNSDEAFTGLYTGMETYTYYCDYAATPTTPRFKGKVELPSYQSNNVRLSGRRSDLFLADIFVTASFTAEDGADILRDLITLYGNGRYTVNGVVASTGVAMTVSWNRKPWLEVMKDICIATGCDYYVDATDDVQFFAAGSRVNADEAIVHDANLIEIGTFAQDISQVKNYVRVTGADSNGVQVVYTAQDAASIALYGKKELNIQDTNLTDYASAKAYGDYLLADGLNPPITGDAKSIVLATLDPGQSIILSSPADGMAPMNRNIVKVVTDISKDGAFSTCTINKNPRQLSQVLRKRVEAENAQQNTSSNLFDLDYSYPISFAMPVGSTSNTSIDANVLHLVAAGTGTWISPPIALSSNLAQVSVSLDAEMKTAIAIEVSADGGITYQSVTEGNLLVMGASTGESLVIRLTLTDLGAQVKALAAYYSVGG